VLKPKHVGIFYGIVLFVFLVTGCVHQVKPVYRIELKRSDIHRLVVKNQTGEEITILSAKDAEDPVPLSVPANGFARVVFSLVEIADLEQSEFGWFRIIEGSETILLHTNSDYRYLDMEGIDALLCVKTASGEKWNFLLSLEGCPMKSTAVEEHVLSIYGPPEAGIPIDLCE